MPAALVLGDEAPEGSTKRMVYLVTFPHPKQALSSTGIRLVSPGSLTKQQVLACFLDSCENPLCVHLPGRIHACSVPLKFTGVWREFHKPDVSLVAQIHDHVPVLAHTKFRYLPVKRALLNRHGLASHWSCTHDGYWSAIRYVARPSPQKPLATLDRNPELWPVAHPFIDDCVNPPNTAAAMQTKRRKMCDLAAEQGKDDPRVTELDVWALVVRTGIKNSDDDRNADAKLAQYAKQHCSQVMFLYLFKNRAKLNNLIDDTWRWERIDDVVSAISRTRLEAMAAARASTCTCRGEWLNVVVSSAIQNHINLAELCYDVRTSLERGRSESTLVIVLAGSVGGEGKSVFLKGLFSVFEEPGFVFVAPDKGNFPLVDLPSAKVCFLDEFRFDPRVVSYALQCLWFDGSAVPITRPQNVAGVSGHCLYKGSAPIFANGNAQEHEQEQEQKQK